MRWFALALLSLALAPSARAQSTAALMPATGGDELAFETTSTARATAIATLRGAGFLVLEDVRVGALLDEETRECLPGDPCTAEVFDRLGVDVLVGLELSGDGDAATDVRALVVRGPGAVAEGSAAVDDELEAAVRSALDDALAQGPAADRGPFLRIEAPAGARAELDGRDVGVIPLTVAASAGAHRVRALGDGQEAEAAVTLPDDPAHTEPLSLSFDEGGAPTEPPEAPLAWATAVGAGTIAAGVVLGAMPPAISFLSAGCTNADCTEFEEVDDSVWAWAAIGGAVAVAGVVLVIVGATSEPEAASVAARIGPGRVTLEGRF